MIKTWQERRGPLKMEEAMQDEIDELRQAIEQAGKMEPVLVVARHDLEKLLKRPEGDKHIKAFIPPGMGDEVLLYVHPPTAPNWNKRIRDSVDSLLAHAGYAEDSSARHQLACMNFDAPARLAVPQGWKLVPIEPTAEMKTAGINVEVYQDSPPEIGSLTWHEVKEIFTAMLSAAPTAPAQQPLTIERIKSMDYRGTLDEHIRAVRMTEAAHGIKGASLPS